MVDFWKIYLHVRHWNFDFLWALDARCLFGFYLRFIVRDIGLYIPYIGPILAAIPAVLIAFTQSPLKALYSCYFILEYILLKGTFMTPI